MTDKELRELDAWIAFHVMGRDDVKWDGQISWDADKMMPPRYTTDPAAAFEVLEKCAEQISPVAICIEKFTNEWACYSEFKTKADDDGATGNTLPLTIMLFAKSLFTK